MIVWRHIRLVVCRKQVKSIKKHHSKVIVCWIRCCSLFSFSYASKTSLSMRLNFVLWFINSESKFSNQVLRIDFIVVRVNMNSGMLEKRFSSIIDVCYWGIRTLINKFISILSRRPNILCLKRTLGISPFCIKNWVSSIPPFVFVGIGGSKWCNNSWVSFSRYKLCISNILIPIIWKFKTGWITVWVVSKIDKTIYFINLSGSRFGF